MARQKQATPLRRTISTEYTSGVDRSRTSAKTARSLFTAPVMAKNEKESLLNGHTTRPSIVPPPQTKQQAGALQLLIGVAGIYISFITWALLQERLTTTPYTSVTTGSEKFKFPVFLNTIQSLLAVCTGLSYLFLSTPAGSKTPSIFPSSAITVPLVAIAFTSSLASPFGYASLAHIDYITFLLAKSCKLLPVMALHITLFRRKYPWHKYLVVLSVTAGVALFTLHASSAKAHKSKTHTVEKNRSWGLLLLGINLLLDGLTNATQDHIFKSFKYSGPQMMCATNILSTALTTGWLLLSPFLASTPVGAWLGLDLSAAAGSGGEFSAALAFLTRHPQAWIDVLGFCACGAVGQLFIFYTLSHFDSVLLVTVTVTRKMITMVLSVLWFGHALTTGQWAGVALVFGGVGAEGWMARREKKAKESGRKAPSKKEI